jgi:hypothetical protein
MAISYATELVTVGEYRETLQQDKGCMAPRQKTGDQACSLWEQIAGTAPQDGSAE